MYSSVEELGSGRWGGRHSGLPHAGGSHRQGLMHILVGLLDQSAPAVHRHGSGKWKRKAQKTHTFPPQKRKKAQES